MDKLIEEETGGEEVLEDRLPLLGVPLSVKESFALQGNVLRSYLPPAICNELYRPTSPIGSCSGQVSSFIIVYKSPFSSFIVNLFMVISLYANKEEPVS